MSTDRARHLRRIGTPAEKRLWDHLRNRRVAGLKFRRQEPIGQRIVDFYCAEARLAIELDGSGHTRDDAKIADMEREEEVKAIGIRILRFFNSEIFDNLDGVLNAIIFEVDPKRSLWAPVDSEVGARSEVDKSDPHLNPLPSEGEETRARVSEANDQDHARSAVRADHSEKSALVRPLIAKGGK